jgi:hypothetical protein
VAQTFNENVRGGLIAFSERKVQNQFRVALDGDEGIRVSKVLIVFGTDALFFLLEVSKNFIAFHILDRDVYDKASHELFALVASGNQQFENGVTVETANALGRLKATESSWWPDSVANHQYTKTSSY